MPFEVLKKRSPESLVPFLGAVAAIALFGFLVGRIVPALRELLTAVYLLLALVSVVFILRWARTRKADRRHGDRRSQGEQS